MFCRIISRNIEVRQFIKTRKYTLTSASTLNKSVANYHSAQKNREGTLRINGSCSLDFNTSCWRFMPFHSMCRRNAIKTSVSCQTHARYSTDSEKHISPSSEDAKPEPIPTSSELSRLFSLARPETSKLAGAIGLLAISSSVTLAVPFCMGKLIDLINVTSSSGGVDDTLLKVTIGLSAIFVLGAMANAGRVYLLQISGQNIMRKLRERVFTSILSQEIAFFDRSRTGELINRLAADTELVSSSVTQNISDGLRSLAQVMAGIGMMFFMSPQLAKVVLCVVPPVAVTSIIYGRYLRNITQKTQTALAESTQTAEEKIGSIRTVRAFASENLESQTYSEMVSRVLNLGKKEAVARALFFGLMGLSGNSIMLIVLYYGGLMMQSSVISVGELSAFLLYSAYVGISIAGLSSFYSTVNKSLGASTRLWELSDRVPQIPLNDGIVPSISLQKSDIVFNDVTFAYPTRSGYPIFNNLDLTVAAGSITGVVGSSGSGKSTIGSLLLRFYEPNSGSIQIGGIDLKDINPTWIRSKIGTVSQEPVLFSGSIRENISYGSADLRAVAETELIEVAKQANIYEFISSLPEKFETVVGERGITLSGGQRQRIAIARALLKNPQILILDEATSALDAESEHLVQEALDRLMVGRTTITIAHRLSTIKHADVIAVLSNSPSDGTGARVAELGSYQNLMNLENGIFRKLVERQTQNTN